MIKKQIPGARANWYRLNLLLFIEDQIKIRKYRTKKFTKYRNPYKTYNNADWH